MGIFYGKKCNSVSLGVISGKKIYWCIVGGYFWWKKCNGVTLLTKKWQGKYCFVIVVLLTTHITILWFGAVSQYKISLVTLLVFKIIPVTLFFFIRTKFIRTLCLRFGEILRILWTLNLTRFFNCSYVEILRLKFPFSTKNAIFLWL